MVIFVRKRPSMLRIQTLLKKIDELSAKEDKLDIIEVDLMLDYTKVLYADLLELRSKKVYTGSLGTETKVEKPKPEEISNTSTTTPPQEIKQQEPQQLQINEEIEIEVKEQEFVASEAPKVAVEAQEGHQKIIPQPEPLQMAFEQKRPKEKRDINKIIGINDKYQYISELFGNDKVAYEETLARVSDFEDADDALSWLKEEVSKEQNWDNELISVQMFYDTVNVFFSAK